MLAERCSSNDFAKAISARYVILPPSRTPAAKLISITRRNPGNELMHERKAKNSPEASFTRGRDGSLCRLMPEKKSARRRSSRCHGPRSTLAGWLLPNRSAEDVHRQRFGEVPIRNSSPRCHAPPARQLQVICPAARGPV